ncbi:MAG: hypothetical protein IT371_08885 [Deltaproteobacteria bacterium]|nr:hypothetical protein [Deltaproteobacteria bacterium]
MTLRTRRLRGILLAALAVTSAAGCFNPDYGDGGFTCNEGKCPEGLVCRAEGLKHVCRPSGFVPSAQPQVSATANPTTLRGGDKVRLTITVTNFALVDPEKNTEVKTGEGHYHVFLDDRRGAYLALGFKGEIEVDIPRTTQQGKHDLIVALVQSNHTLHPSGAHAVVPITVRP